MNFTRFHQLTLGLILCLGLGTIGFSQTERVNSEPGSASIGGQLTIDGKPAAGKKILIAELDSGWGAGRLDSEGYGVQGRNYIQVTTDREGRYQLAGLKPGKYEASVDLLKAYAPVGRSDGRTRSITLNAGAEVRDVDFALIRGGVLTGRVTSGEGIPIAGALVRANTIDEKLAGHGLYFGQGRTDDRGVYRIYGLPAGRYRVSSDGTEHGVGAAWTNRGPLYVNTFHPGVTDESDAALITIKPGDERSGVDIRFGKKNPLMEVAGRVVDSASGKNVSQKPSFDSPTQREMLQCQLLGPQGFPKNAGLVSSLIDSDGNFRFAGLSPGRYGCDVRIDNYSGQQVQFEVKENPIKDLVVRVSRGAILGGRVVLDESSNRRFSSRLHECQIAAKLIDLENGIVVREISGSSSSEIRMDGGFRLSGLRSGNVALEILLPNDGPRPQLLRIERDGVKAPNIFEIKGSEIISNLRLIMVFGHGVIRGQIKIAGDLAADQDIMITVERLDSPSKLGAFKVNSEGQFICEGLLDGEYRIDAHSFSKLKTGKDLFGSQRVRVAGGSESSVTLLLSPLDIKKGGVR